MKEEEGFYYPHNLDFRGRAYPMHPHLNHIGSDFCRGTLEFAEGRPLGESGLRWLKIHLANLYAGGVDKLSYKDRISFTENHLDEIFDSADRPLEGSRWWLGAEDPFQCLAVCIDLSEALRSPSPETTISHMPVHQVLVSLFFYLFPNYQCIVRFLLQSLRLSPFLKHNDIASYSAVLITVYCCLFPHNLAGWFLQWLATLCSSWEGQGKELSISVV